MFESDDYLTEGLMEKEALRADFEGEIPTVWSFANLEDEGGFIERPENPFEDLLNRVQEHKSEGDDLAGELRNAAEEVLESFDTIMARKDKSKTGSEDKKSDDEDEDDGRVECQACGGAIDSDIDYDFGNGEGMHRACD